MDSSFTLSDVCKKRKLDELVAADSELIRPSFREYKGDLLKLTLQPNDFIVHQTNCRTVSARGLAKHLFARYPQANTYKLPFRKGDIQKYCGNGSAPTGISRIPGSISVHHPVINLYGQDGHGKMPSASDGGRQRLQWFREGLAQIDHLMRPSDRHPPSPRVPEEIDLIDDDENSKGSTIYVGETLEVGSTLAASENHPYPSPVVAMASVGTLYFPYQIGCGLAGGDWVTYRSILKEWAEGKPFSVHILNPN